MASEATQAESSEADSVNLIGGRVLMHAGLGVSALMILMAGLSVPGLPLIPLFPGPWLTVIFLGIAFIALGVVWAFYHFRVLAPTRDLEKSLRGFRAESNSLPNTGRMREFQPVLKIVNSTLGKLKDTRENLQGLSGDLETESAALVSAAGKFSSSSQSLGSTAESSSASIEELHASIDQVANSAGDMRGGLTTIHQTIGGIVLSSGTLKGSAEELRERARETAHAAREGEAGITRLTEAIEGIQESSDKISAIVKMIHEISDKTNLLSLNASIEAARAGEAGLGFAVVANEIGKLSELTAQNVKDIAALVAEVESTVQDGTTLITESIRLFKGIMEGIAEIGNSTEELSRTTREQDERLGEILNEFQKLSDISTFIAGAVREQRTASGELVELVQTVSRESQEQIQGSDSLAVLALKIMQLVVRIKAA